MSEKKIVTRFAPSPTGRLHIGSARSAILNWIYAKKYNGKFILRIDDTDSERSKEEFINSIKEDLKWLNINWELTFKQSERNQIYNKKIQELKNINRLYPCFETQEELLLKRKSLLSSGKPPIYDRGALKLSDKEKEDLISKGKKPHWRFLLENKNIFWNDLIRGEINFNSLNLSDPILIREDKSLLYHLPSVIDDISENVTDIIRGEDHITNTAFHIQIFEAFNSKPPNFGHHSLLIDSKGKNLSKRLNSLSLENIRNDHIESLTILNYLSAIGTSNNFMHEAQISNIIDSFEIFDLAKSTAKFNREDLFNINSELLKNMPFELIQTKLEKIGIKNPSINFWNFVKNNINTIDEALNWWNIVNHSGIFINQQDDLLQLCANHLPDEPFDFNTWDKWISLIKKDTDKRGKNLFQPIRIALTGKESGPELKYLLPLLNRKLILKRLGC